MLVTEGKGSGTDRRIYALTALGVLAAGAGLFAALPPLIAPVVVVALVLAAGVAARHAWLSLLSPFVRPRAEVAPGAPPSVALVIPCLNELPSLQRTVPALARIEYAGELRFCYVCESASTDGTIDYVRERAAEDDRIVCILKETPPGGRGAAIRYGIEHAPPSEVVGFLDADHIIEQGSIDALAGVFGGDDPPAAVQGMCASLNEPRNWLTRLLSVERRWLERTELEVGPALGGMSHFGGGQGFFRRDVLEEERFDIDESMILDDTDLSIRLALAGAKVAFRPEIVTESLQPETPMEFVDQRFRWGRGWLQISRRYFLSFLRPGLSLPLRADLLRFISTPYAGGAIYLAFAAGAVALATGARTLPGWALWGSVLWPFLLGFLPCLTGAVRRVADVPVALLGIPMLYYAYASLCAVSLVDFYVLRRQPRYAKTRKRLRPDRKEGADQS